MADNKAVVATICGAVIGGLLMLLLQDPLLGLATAALGGLLTASALAALLPPEWTVVSPLAGLAVAVLGALAQLRSGDQPAPERR